MSFIQPDEHIVIMDYNCAPARPLNDEELVRLRDAGIKTVACYLEWNLVETSKGVYDWSSMDAEVARIRAAGIKAIVKTYVRAPEFFPDDWYVRTANGTIQNVNGPEDAHFDPISWSILSYWNQEAWSYHLDFVVKVCKHYSADDVLCINIAPTNGEALIFGNGCLYDKHAIESYQEFVGSDSALPVENAIVGTPTLDWMRATVIPAQVESQRIFKYHGGEYWTQLHHAFETIPSTGNWLIDDFYAELHRELGDEHWGMCYTVFRPGETRGLWGPKQDIERHGVKMLYASEGADGLLRNTQESIRQGARGMMTGPLAPYMGHKRMEDWMYSAIRTTLGWWEGK